MGEVFPELEDPTVEKLMAGYSKRRLAETIAVNQRQMDQVSRELATAQWQAQLLADQRDRLLKHLEIEPLHVCSGPRWCQVCVSWGEAYDIMITDPRDEGNHGA